MGEIGAGKLAPGDVVHRNGGAGQGDIAGVSRSGAEDGQGHLRAGLAGNAPYHLEQGQPGDILAVDLEDDLAGTQTGLLGRGAVEGGDNHHMTAFLLHLGTDSFIAAAGEFLPPP